MFECPRPFCIPKIVNLKNREILNTKLSNKVFEVSVVIPSVRETEKKTNRASNDDCDSDSDSDSER